MVIQHDYFAHSSGILELEDRFLLHTKYHNIFASDTDLLAMREAQVLQEKYYSACPFPHCFVCIFHLRV